MIPKYGVLKEIQSKVPGHQKCYETVSGKIVELEYLSDKSILEITDEYHH